LIGQQSSGVARNVPFPANGRRIRRTDVIRPAKQHATGWLAVLNEKSRQIILLIRTVYGDNLNVHHVSVVEMFSGR
jgi:hypothetical protein